MTGWALKLPREMKPRLLFSGTMGLNPPSFLGNGLRCCGGSVIRIATHVASDGASVFGYPNPGEKISVRSLAPAGTNRCYQVWYRNPLGPCAGQFSNLTNGYTIAWH